MTQVLAGCEPWACEGGDAGVLVVHGFTGNPVSLRPLAEALGAAGFAVEMPLLPGHGLTDWRGANLVDRHDWAREVVAAFERLRVRARYVVAFGLSFGGALALRLAQTRGDDLTGLVLVNPWVRHTHPAVKLLPVLKWVVPGVPGVGNDIAKPGADEQPYPKVPVKALASALSLQRDVRRDLPKVTVPTLVFTSRQDHAVDPDNSRLILEQISSPDREQVWLERSYHVATLDYDADLIRDLTDKFVQRVAAA